MDKGELIKTILTKLVVEEKKFAKRIAESKGICLIEEDKEPICAVVFPKDNLFLTFGSDFGLQSFINRTLIISK